MDQTYYRRMLHIADSLAAQGVGRYTAAPPYHRIAWRLGLRLPPPLYQSFTALALSMGTYFALFWGASMWFLFWSPEGMPGVYAALLSLGAGVLYGLISAGYYRWKARRLELPPLNE